jgi:colanic acid biosynthesis glycosyl transferase WcaI
LNILIYSANFAPEPTGIGKYSGEMAAWLAQRGHTIRVIAAPPYYPAWKVDPDHRWPPYRRERWNGVDVWRAPLWVPQRPGGAARALHLASFAASSAPLALASALWRPDVVLTVAPFLTCAPTGWLAARLSGAKAWLHIQDFEVDAAFGLGMLEGGLLRRFALGCERRLLRRFDVVSTISNRMIERLHAKGVLPERTRLFPNWVDAERIRPLSRASAYRAELLVDDNTVVALFSGTLGPKQGLSIIPEAARRLAHRPGVLFVICGDGVMKPTLEQACDGLANVRLLPLQPTKRLCELLNLADIHLLTQSPGAEDLVLPSKLTGMLASGRPIVATCRQGSEIASVVTACGVIVAPDNADELAAAIVRLADDGSRRRALGVQARSWAERKLTLDAILGRVAEELAGSAGRAGITVADRG